MYTHVSGMYVLHCTCIIRTVCMSSIVRFERGKKATFWNPPPPPWRSCRINRVLHSFLRKVAQKMRTPVSASFEPTFMTIGKILDLSDKISTGENIWGRFWKKSKNVKNVSKKPILYCWWLKFKYFFSKTKGEVDYSKRYKTMTMPVS